MSTRVLPGPLEENLLQGKTFCKKITPNGRPFPFLPDQDARAGSSTLSDNCICASQCWGRLQAGKTDTIEAKRMNVQVPVAVALYHESVSQGASSKTVALFQKFRTARSLAPCR